MVLVGYLSQGNTIAKLQDYIVWGESPNSKENG